MRTGIATFTLDYGACPKWLFDRMVKLGRAMTEVIVREYGPEEFIKRLADPVWFQALGTVLAFDWNASGLTTTLTAALKEAIRGQEKDLGVFICGGKGKTSRKTPEQILNWGTQTGLDEEKIEQLVYNSKMVAKVDSALVQDGFQIYHHTFFFSLQRGLGLAKKVAWTVVQQGMNQQNQTARRYHWHSADVKDLVCEPHTAVVSDLRLKPLNLVAKDSENTRELSVELVTGGFQTLMKDLQLLNKYNTNLFQILELKDQDNYLKLLNLENKEFKYHPVINENFLKNKYLQKILYQLCENKPKNYENLVASYGVGPKTIRALALVGEILYGAKPSYQDPARYSFAHGGKDATPYPIDRPTYDQTILVMKKLTEKMRVNYSDKMKIIRRLDFHLSK